MIPLSSLHSVQHHIREGQHTCKQQVQYHLDRIQALRHLNAFVEVYAEEALTRADQIDQKVKKGNAGKLAGLVIGIKDVLCYKDHGVQAASRILNGFHSSYSATVVERLLSEDAIIIGRQNCDEFGMGSTNENSSYGPVLHPQNTAHVPGGSSGGSAVAVATNMCMASLGSDTGGSVRQPAAFCGILGLKPTYSRLSRHGLLAYASSFDCVGILANHVEDVATILAVCAGPDEFDSTVSHEPVPDYANLLKEKSNRFRIAMLDLEGVDNALQPEVKQALASTRQKLEALGHQVSEVAFPLLAKMLPTYYILVTAEASSNLSRYDGVRYGHRSAEAHDLESMYKKTRAEAFGKEVQRRILLGNFVLSSDYYDAYYAQAQRVRKLIRDATMSVLSQFDFLLTPTTPTTAPRQGAHQHPLEMYLGDVFSVQANVTGIPAISVPAGTDAEGLPIGMQFMGRPFEEARLLQLANSLMK